MSTLSTTVRRGLVVTAAAVAAGPAVGGIASAASGPTTSAPLAASPLGTLPLAGGLTGGLPVAGLTQGLPLADGLDGLSGGLGNLAGVPVAGPALSGLTTHVIPMNGSVPRMTGLPDTNTAANTAANTATTAANTAAAAAPEDSNVYTFTAGHPATRSRKAVTTPHTSPYTAPYTAGTPAVSADGTPGPAMAGPKLLAGMPMTDTQLGPDAPSLSSLPQYAGVKKIQELGPAVAAGHAAGLAEPPSLPVIGQLPTASLAQNLPLAGGLAQSLPGLGGLSGLLGKF